MKTATAGLLAGAILGTSVGIAIGILFSSFLLPSSAADGEISGPGGGELVAHGSFVHVDPTDPVHYGSGRVTLFTNVVELDDDFEVGAGPDYHVYLVPDAEITPETRVEETMFVDLGRLKAFAGSQSYPVPAGMDLSDYPSVVIWCEHFNVLISAATVASPHEVGS